MSADGLTDEQWASIRQKLRFATSSLKNEDAIRAGIDRAIDRALRIPEEVAAGEQRHELAMKISRQVAELLTTLEQLEESSPQFQSFLMGVQTYAPYKHVGYAQDAYLAEKLREGRELAERLSSQLFHIAERAETYAADYAMCSTAGRPRDTVSRVLCRSLLDIIEHCCPFAFRGRDGRTTTELVAIFSEVHEIAHPRNRNDARLAAQRVLRDVLNERESGAHLRHR